jgi:hypothetical protein
MRPGWFSYSILAPQLACPPHRFYPLADYQDYKIKALFAIMDTDQNGLIDETEFFEVLNLLLF